jgi:hypothetical protein
MLEIHTEIRIKANPEEVWEVLCYDAERMASFNPQIVRIKGSLKEGATLSLRIRFAPWLLWTGKANVLRIEPPNLVRWRGGLPIRGLFYGDHSFEILEEEGGALLVQREVYTGILAPILLSTLLRGTEAGFRTANERIKEAAEKLANGS